MEFIRGKLRGSSPRAKGTNEIDGLDKLGNGAEGRGSFVFNVEDRKWVKKLPKAELHVHFPGAFNLALIWEKYEDEIKLSFEDFEKECTCKGKRSLEEMLKTFDKFQKLVKNDFELIEELAYDFVQKQKEQKIIYTEIRYSPHLISEEDPDLAFEAVTRGLRRGCEEFKVTVNQILCCIDKHPEWSDQLVELARERSSEAPCQVVGVDVAAGEEYFLRENSEDRAMHDAAIEKAIGYDLNVTIHAGEDGGTENIDYAINNFHASRIGHGYALAGIIREDGYEINELHQKIKAKDIHFEVCLTSSYETGGWVGDDGDHMRWKKHPVLEMKKAGYSFSFNTDDPTVFQTDLTREILIALAKVGLTRADVVTSMNEAIEHSWATAEQRMEFIAELSHVMSDLL